MRVVSPTTFAVNSLPYVWSLGVEEEYDASDEHKPLLTQSDETVPRGKLGVLGQKIIGVNWRNMLTILITVVNYYISWSTHRSLS